jgi:hypothetical protein
MPLWVSLKGGFHTIGQRLKMSMTWGLYRNSLPAHPLFE